MLEINKVYQGDCLEIGLRLICCKNNGRLWKMILSNIYNNIEECKTVGQISANSVINADCLDAMNYIADKSVDMILCDLPYG